MGIEYVETMIVRCDTCDKTLASSSGPWAFHSQDQAKAAARAAGWDVVEHPGATPIFICPTTHPQIGPR